MGMSFVWQVLGHKQKYKFEFCPAGGASRSHHFFGITKVIAIDPGWTWMCAKFHGNLFSSFWEMSACPVALSKVRESAVININISYCKASIDNLFWLNYAKLRSNVKEPNVWTHCKITTTKPTHKHWYCTKSYLLWQY